MTTTETFEFSEDWTGVPVYCGMDVHKHVLAVTVYARDDSRAEFVKTAVFGTDSAALQMFWGFVHEYKPVKFVMEATNVYHHVVCTFLEERKVVAGWDYDVLVVNPADAAGMPGRQKNDSVDSKWLARYAAAGLIKGGRPIVLALEDLRSMFRTAYRIERDRTAMKNRIKKTLDRAGFRPKRFDLNTIWVRDFVFHLSDHDGTVGEFLTGTEEKGHPMNVHATSIERNMVFIEPYLDVKLSIGQKALIRQDVIELDFKAARKALLAVEIDRIIAVRPALRNLVMALASIPGLSAYSAAWLVAEAGPVQRYNNVAAFLGYCGCCPRCVTSARKVYSAHTSKHSNKYARTLFFNAAKVVCSLVKQESALKRYATRTAARKKRFSMKLAYSIISAKIARIAYSIMLSGKKFVNEPGFDSKNNPKLPAGMFTVAERKDVRNARRMLDRVAVMKQLGPLAERAAYFADALDRMLREN